MTMLSHTNQNVPWNDGKGYTANGYKQGVFRKIILFLTRFTFLYRTDELGLINKAQTLK